MSIFGNSGGGGSLFGGGGAAATTTTAGGGSLFGSAPTAAPAAGGSLFGGGAAGTTTAGGATSSLFGNAQPAAPAATGGSLFGAAAAGQPAAGGTTSLFGNSTAAAPNTSGGGLFGSTTTTQAATGGGLFGNSAPAVGNTAGAAPPGGLFGGGAAASSSIANGGIQTLGLNQQQMQAKTILEQSELENCFYELQKLDNDRVARNVGWTYHGVSASADSQLLQSALAELSQYDHIKHGPDVNKFRLAKAQNPFDQHVALPVRLLGFEQLKQHFLQQDQKLSEQDQKVAELSSAIKSLRTSVEAKLSVQLAEARSRHLKLTRQLVAILTQLEAFGVQVGACRRDYDRESALENKFTQIDNEVQGIRVGELLYMAHGLALQEDAGQQSVLSKQELEKVITLIANQTELSEELQSCLREKQREIAVMGQALRIGERK
ncbi:unnamed protein product [Amoebophrya sp. A25]|nr:unnamed protein product [Amoebophrya sp. A25]|eukprot:GSA25T00009880001.1